MAAAASLLPMPAVWGLDVGDWGSDGGHAEGVGGSVARRRKRVDGVGVPPSHKGVRWAHDGCGGGPSLPPHSR